MQIIRRIFLDGYHSIFYCPGQKYGVDRGRDPEVLTLNLILDFRRNCQTHINNAMVQSVTIFN